jgi:UDP:flavonoid glycosyltransferase YjiC (YdhE family)
MGRILTALAAAQFSPPPNVILETFVPHGAVLPHVDAMVTQCGLGTLMKALAHGVPLVCIPLVGDQPDNAARVVAQGAGLRVPADAPPVRIREAIERVVTDPSFRQAAQQLATRMASEDAVQAAVDEIVAVTVKRPEQVAGSGGTHGHDFRDACGEFSRLT